MSVRTASPISRKLQNWDTKAAVRVKPRRFLLRDEEEMGKVYFSPELAHVAQHPLVQQLGAEAIREVQVRYLYRYLDFTTQLELEVINTASKEIALGKLDLELPDAMREDAFKLCTDEAHHAYFSDDIKRQVIAATGIAPGRPATPGFLKRLRALQRPLPADLVPFSELLFTVVSETLISSILAQIPRDERVVTAVRDIVADHADDEGRHSAYFSQFFGYLWPRMSVSQRHALGPLIPQFILAFLQPDHAAIGRDLSSLSLDGEQIQTIIDETYSALAVASNARRAATVTLRLVENKGVLEDPRIADAFRACGLAD